jgi:uncharacterized protein (DUF58 family)
MVIFLVLILTVLLLNLLVRFYRKSWSDNLSISVEFDGSAYQEGDSGNLIETMTNKKILPFWWGSIQYHIPSFIKIDDEYFHGHDDYKGSISAFSYEMVKKSLPFTAQARGYYKITDAELLTQDIFFKYRFIKQFPVSTEIYIYPDFKLLQDLNIDFKRITGEVIVKRHFIEDQFQFRGIRDYTMFDSLKSVNWNATAKTSEMKSNQYHFTVSQDVTILLDFDPRGSWDRQALKEDMIRAAARLLDDLNQSGIPVGLATNAADVDNGTEISLPCRNGLNHWEDFMRLLSRINTDQTTRSFCDIIDERIQLPSNSQYILLSYAQGAELQKKVAALKAISQNVQWILFKEKDDKVDVENVCGLTICEVS